MSQRAVAHPSGAQPTPQESVPRRLPPLGLPWKWACPELHYRKKIKSLGCKVIRGGNLDYTHSSFIILLYKRLPKSISLACK